MISKTKWPCLISVMFLSGCFSTGKDFPDDLNWIKKEKTSQNDVRLVLGSPYSVGNSGGVTTWTYGYYEYKIFGKANHKELKFYWGPDLAVKHFNYSSSFPESGLKQRKAPLKQHPASADAKKQSPDLEPLTGQKSGWKAY